MKRYIDNTKKNMVLHTKDLRAMNCKNCKQYFIHGVYFSGENVRCVNRFAVCERLDYFKNVLNTLIQL